MNNIIKNTLIFTVSFLLIASLFTLYDDTGVKAERVGVDSLISRIENGEIKEIVVKGNIIELELNDGKKETVKKELGESFSTLLDNYGVDKEKVASVAIQVKDDEGFSFWFTALAPFLIPFLIIGFLLYMMFRGVQGANSRAMGFGQAQVKLFDKEAKNKVKFRDVAGVREAKEELTEVVDFLKNPDKFTNLGARVPKGVLLLGSPGTGKTLLARAVAGEAKVAFFHISGSEFVEMFVGVGASRVRSLFKTAKKSTPCIIFIDEIDAVGRKRGAGMGGSHDEREQTLNQILVEMDGFDPRMNIIVMAATNRPDVLDTALLRPGRFDRQIVLDLPDIKAREAILKIHARKKPLAREVKLRRVAERTPGFSGADLANILNEAAILTARRDKKLITMDELFESIERVMMGPERRSRVISDKEKQITAYHEAGHAVVAHFLPHTDPVQKVTIIARGRAGGYTLKIPLEDKHMHTKQEFIEEIAVLMGGYLTEKEIYGEVTTGATSDLRRATQLARKLITDYGMSNVLGPRTFGDKEDAMFLGRDVPEQRDYSEKVAELIDKEIGNFIAEATVLAKKVIKKEKAKIKVVVNELLKKETIEKELFEKLLKNKK